ncbi:MAG TPA: ATP-binding cassette domain-containing protein [Candidatus Acidoferrales bacterium]|nr:ATP-binding cassette domain-containing protein [Candidatus Acidoferrales bacterium]
MDTPLRPQSLHLTYDVMNTNSPSPQGVNLSVRGLHMSYNGNEVLKGINLDVNAGEIFVIIGPSGGGKSVLLRQIIGLEEPDQGEVLIEGQPIESPDITRRYRVAMVFQSGALLTSMTVGENVGFYLAQHRLKTPDEIAEIVAKGLQEVGLKGIEDKMPDELSGGMRKRVAIARALVVEPQLILYDEPTSELDPLSSVNISEDIVKLNGRIGATSVVVSHDRELAFGIAHRIAMLDEGRIIATGTPDEMKANPDPRVQQFLNAKIPQAPPSSAHVLPNVSIPGRDGKLPLPVVPDDEVRQFGVAPAGHLHLAIPATAAKGRKSG